jgi:hypothetical protein
MALGVRECGLVENYIVNNTTGVLELGVVGLNTWIMKVFDILCVVDFCQVPRVDVKHTLADKLLARLAVELLERLVETDEVTIYILLE